MVGSGDLKDEEWMSPVGMRLKGSDNLWGRGWDVCRYISQLHGPPSSMAWMDIKGRISLPFPRFFRSFVL